MTVTVAFYKESQLGHLKATLLDFTYSGVLKYPSNFLMFLACQEVSDLITCKAEAL